MDLFSSDEGDFGHTIQNDSHLNSSSDWHFYQSHRNVVDNFIAAVCGKATKVELGNLIAASDDLVACRGAYSNSESGLVNRMSYKHENDGRSPLSYAAAKNLYQQVYDLIDLGAEVSKTMPARNGWGAVPKTAFVIAATNPKRDGTEMVRILLSKGASPKELEAARVDETILGRGMKYWIEKARRVGVPSELKRRHMAHLSPMDRIHELDYSVVGEEAAVASIQEALASRFGNHQGSQGKPLVMLFLGPPGHGKTYFASNAARSLVGQDNFKFVPCQSIRDDADLFGSRLGGSRSGQYSSDGELTGWLRHRQGKKCIVFLDEFEKMKKLTSSLGWKQDKKIYQSFLQPWNDGLLSDQGSMPAGRGEMIDCKQSIWILTSNWGQEEILRFWEKHKERMHSTIEKKDAEWIQKHLVEKILQPLLEEEFGDMDKGLKALSRRIDCIIPFLPFSKREVKVVADIALTNRFSWYREPCVLHGPEDQRRSLGNLRMQGTRAFAAYAGSRYDPMKGANGMLSAAQKADGKFQLLFFHDQLGLSEEQEARVMSEKPPTTNENEPTFWVHFDKDAKIITITQSRPVDDDSDDDDDDSSSSESPLKGLGDVGPSASEKELLKEGNSRYDVEALPTRCSTAADDAF
ncbi:Caseinolytic peptidase B protein homolog [Seminavis robusta]|uniref:Caseinolytic peptidase B protein homolog n=1 Tax=Seminavis robusta TaxID=568900 RepID=A0A9N8E5Z3_9STRA|nr:Caseinolytic peptidase B protein homolog [Seminavis robusta]|eukprot:Sro551_g164850.1 Caseinolytic peptidase B protein homolog (635) ;mRNA; f:22184-24088